MKKPKRIIRGYCDVCECERAGSFHKTLNDFHHYLCENEDDFEIHTFAVLTEEAKKKEKYAKVGNTGLTALAGGIVLKEGIDIIKPKKGGGGKSSKNSNDSDDYDDIEDADDSIIGTIGRFITGMFDD